MCASRARGSLAGMPAFSARHRVVIAGAGVAGLEALLAVRRLAPDDVEAVLVAPTEHFRQRAMQVEQPFGGGGGARRFALSSIARDAGARHLRDGLLAVEPERRQVRLHSGERLRYDSLLLALGAIPYPAFAHGVSFDREHDAEPFDELLEDIDAGFVGHVAVVVPQQVAWTLPAYELALSIVRFGAGPGDRRVRVTLVTHEREPLAAFGATASRVVAGVLDEAGIELHVGTEPVVVHDTALVVRDRWLTAARILALPRLAGPRTRGVPTDRFGFVEVDEHGAVRGLDGVYAAGDGTAGTVKQGGLAAQQADAAVAHLLWRAGLGPRPEPPRHVLRGVLRTPRGVLHLEAQLGGAHAGHGSIASWKQLWPAPGRVASKWLAAYLEGTPPDRRLVHA
jgi:sulfide:quinone oxidoreductase